MDKLRVGVIGCGGIANGKHFPALNKLRNRIELVGFCDIIEDRATSACQKYGDPNAKFYVEHRRLLEDKSIDVVYVLTPNVSHCAISVDSLEAGKHVLCEKPMAATYADAKKMLDAAKRTGKKLTIGYQNRFRRNVQFLQKACRAGDLGDIYFARAQALRRKGVPTWGVFSDKSKQGGGPLIDLGTHVLDITLWMMNNYKPKQVVGSVFHKLKDSPEGNMFGPWNPKTHEVEDSAFGFIKMENGATISLEASWAINIRKDESGLTLCGTLAGAETIPASAPMIPVNSYEPVIFNTVRHGELVDTGPMERSGLAAADWGGEPFRVGDAESTAWLDAIVNNTEVYVKPEQALVVTRILEAIYKSAESGTTVEFTEEKQN
ncbi:MAG TPA: Gfo/Idh/MocA family oxidoreductase [Terriglobales bacterium]|nr:Gfo/Idh/MocA family oxidoreductase [Terriglobales bacterium]